MNVAIVKYNAGNIYSVVNALKRFVGDPRRYTPPGIYPRKY